MGMLENYFVRGYERIAVPNDAEERGALIKNYAGKEVAVRDRTLRGILRGVLEETGTDGHYVVQPKIGRGKILFSNHLLRLFVKSKEKR